MEVRIDTVSSQPSPRAFHVNVLTRISDVVPPNISLEHHSDCQRPDWCYSYELAEDYGVWDYATMLRNNNESFFGTATILPFDMVAPVPASAPIDGVYSVSSLIILTVFYILIFFVGFLGNTTTVMVIMTSHFMHTKTNFYLCSLAFSDILLLLFGLPFDVIYMWRPHAAVGGNIFCMIRGLISETATNASVLTIVGFTIERWVAICKPFQNFSNTGRLAVHFMFIWGVALVAALPLAYQFGTEHYYDTCECSYNTNITLCMVVAAKRLAYSFEISSILFFVIPMALIACFYGLIIKELRKSLRLTKSSENSPMMEIRLAVRQQIQARRLVIRMLLTVVSVFFICFVPLHVQRLLTTYTEAQTVGHNTSYYEFLKALYAVSGFLYYLSTAVNPVIYNLLSRKFRIAFCNLLYRWKQRKLKKPKKKLKKPLEFSWPRTEPSNSATPRHYCPGHHARRPAAAAGNGNLILYAQEAGGAVRGRSRSRSPRVLSNAFDEAAALDEKQNVPLINGGGSDYSNPSSACRYHRYKNKLCARCCSACAAAAYSRNNSSSGCSKTNDFDRLVLQLLTPNSKATTAIGVRNNQSSPGPETSTDSAKPMKRFAETVSV